MGLFDHLVNEGVSAGTALLQGRMEGRDRAEKKAEERRESMMRNAVMKLQIDQGEFNLADGQRKADAERDATQQKIAANRGAWERLSTTGPEEIKPHLAEYIPGYDYAALLGKLTEGQVEDVFDARGDQRQVAGEREIAGVQHGYRMTEQGDRQEFEAKDGERDRANARHIAASRPAAGAGGGRGSMPSEGERKAAAIAPRAVAADATLSRLGADGAPNMARRAGRMVIGQYALTDDQEAFEQAAEEFLGAVVRPESGAALTDSEMERYTKQFIPAPGDSPATLRAKSEARQRALSGLRTLSGRAAPPTTNPYRGNDAW